MTSSGIFIHHGYRGARSREGSKDTHQWLIVVEHEEKVHQGPIFACFRGRQAGLGLRPGLVRT